MNKIRKETDGYVLISTLFFLILSGFFSHSAIQVSSNYVIQLRQVGMGYEAKAALNMSEELLVHELEGRSEPVEGTIFTSVGQVNIKGKKQANQIVTQLSLIKESGDTYKKEIVTPISQIEE